MRILLTGSTGYIGRRLLPVLIQDGHHVICLVRDRRRFDTEDFTEEFLKNITVVEADLGDHKTMIGLPMLIDAAYYLVHSMSSSYPDFGKIEEDSADNFINYINQTDAKQIIYLSGISNDDHLSDHLLSRKKVESVLRKSRVPVTTLRAAIVIGSGSASFEIIRDLVEKLPIMVAPKWLKSKCQPIGIRNVIEYLKGVLLMKETFNEVFDIGGPDILTYKEMLLGFAKVRGLNRIIFTVPILTPKLSSLWLYFVTSTSYSLARSLVSSLKNEVICRDMCIHTMIPNRLLSYEETLEIAFERINQKDIISSWKDAVASDSIDKNFLNYIEVPEHGCYKDKQQIEFDRPAAHVVDNIWRIGGTHGWYYGNWMWGARGIIDKAVGGVGLRRGRRSETDLKTGDALDFWRVLLADKKNGRLLLYAEMKLPGEAWLEFRVKENMFIQTATFRPLGLWGRIYWYAVLPFHGIIFPKMARNIVVG